MCTSVYPHGSEIANFACFVVGGILPERIRLCVSASSMIFTVHACYNRAMVTLFHALSINIYNFMSCEGYR